MTRKDRDAGPPEPEPFLMTSLSDLIPVPGGSFTVGSDDFYLEERPARRVDVAPFRIERTPVTNRQFSAFVDASDYLTLAERQPGPDGQPGSVVFVPPPYGVDLRGPPAWWQFTPGASWRAPQGPGSDLTGLDDHPVVHVAYEDAQAYGRWCGRTLPNEIQWEVAARGGRTAGAFAWGDELAPGGVQMANTWQGAFPHQNLGLDGFERTSPVTAFPPNGYGLLDMIGNVWEWTSDPFGPSASLRPCCGPDPGLNDQRVIKGGSHLCAPNYCQRYRPAARQGQAQDTGTSHMGFRCIGL